MSPQLPAAAVPPGKFGFIAALPAADDAFGFPQKVQWAFADVATRKNSVILSRVPGQACNQLIDERYDLKSYFIKAKSCDWGPMAGFVCMTPELNKKGQPGAADNLNAHRSYLTVLFATGSGQRPVMHPKLPPPGPTDDDLRGVAFGSKSSSSFAPKLNPDGTPVLDANGKPVPDPTKPRAHTAGPAFIPLTISDARKNIVLGVAVPGVTALSSVPVLGSAQVGNGVYVGIATDKSKTVVLEFALVQRTAAAASSSAPAAGAAAGPLPWDVYAGTIYTRASSAEAFVISAPNALLALPAPVLTHTLSGDEATALASLRAKAPATLPGGATSAFTPLMAVQNPYPPQPLGATDYRNAVTGDYDLFSVWPVSPLRDLVRRSELQYMKRPDSVAAPAPKQLASGQPLFKRVAEKPFALESNLIPGLYVEFVSDGRLLLEGNLESDEWGNPTQYVMDVAVGLNIEAASAFSDVGKAAPNVAFHSDEGGRPDLAEMDIPIGVFLPPDLGRMLPAAAQPPLNNPNNPFCVRSADEFVQLIAAFGGVCFMPIQALWLSWLLGQLKDDGTTRLDVDVVRLLVTGSTATPFGAGGDEINLTTSLKSAITYPLQWGNNEYPAHGLSPGQITEMLGDTFTWLGDVLAVTVP